MSSAVRALVVLNPVAGPNAQRVLQRDRLGRALRAVGLPARWHETKPDRNADTIVREHPGEEPVVVIGGDGTVQAAARAVMGTDRPLLIIPRGSGNVLAQRLDLSPRLGPGLRLLREGVPRQLDVGSLGGEPFLLGVGMGIDAQVIREADRRLKKQLGRLAYFMSVAKTLPVRHYDFEIEIDGRVHHESGASVMVANFGSGFGRYVYPPGADGTDGELDVAVMKAKTLEQTFGLLGASFLPREVAEKGLVVRRGTEIRVRSSTRVPVQVDGEDVGDHHEIVCSLRPRSLTVLLAPPHRPTVR